MKVLHINSYYGARTFYKHLYEKQQESGLEIDVYVPVSTAIDPATLELGKYTTISVNHGKYDRILFPIKHRKIYQDIVKQYEIKDYTVVHAHSLFSNGYIALKLKQDYQVPYLVAVRDTDVNLFFKYMLHLRELGLQILAQAERVVFLSKSYRDNVIEELIPASLQEKILNKAIVIPNGIADFWFRNKGQVKNKPDKNNLKLLYVGVLKKKKNIGTTIKAIKRLQKEGYQVKFTIVGSIKNRLIYQRVKDLPFVNYISPQPKEELLKIYRAHDLFVMPSKYESFGLVYAEAMSQGLPVIYTRGQGFDEQFKEGVVGYSTHYKDAQEIKEKIKVILADYQTISANCLQKIDRFKWDLLAKQYRQIYEQIAGQSP